MKKEITFIVDENILLRFNMALQLNNDNGNEVCESLMTTYFLNTFSKEASTYSADSVSTTLSQANGNPFYGKALHKISKWAKRPSQINYKILRAYLQLSDELDFVTYDDLILRCSDEDEHIDVYVPTFTTNFAQMRFDGDKSHGKVFLIDENSIITLWDYIEDEIMKYKDEFLKMQSTDTGYINRNNQMNIGKTELDGTGHLQKLYMMRCLNENCKYEYFANGHDIFLKKCPKCQGGADTGYTRQPNK